MTKHAAERTPERKPSRGRQGTSDKVWAVGLAGATCLGLVGVLGVRAVGDAAAAEPQVDLNTTNAAVSTAASVATSSSGLTEEQLDQYARALEVERVKLEAYHKELLDAAAKLQASADAIAKAGSASTVPASAKSSSTTTTSTNSQKSNNASNKNSSAPKASSKAQSAQPAPKAVTKPAPKPAAKPVPKPAAAPKVAKPQAQTRGS